MLRNPHIVLIFPVFSLCLVSGLIPLWSEKALGFSVSLDLLRLILWPMVLPVGKVACAVEKDAYCCFGQDALYVSVKSTV